MNDYDIVTYCLYGLNDFLVYPGFILFYFTDRITDLAVDPP